MQFTSFFAIFRKQMRCVALLWQYICYADKKVRYAQFAALTGASVNERGIAMQNESRDNLSLLSNELLDKVVGGVNSTDLSMANGRDDICAGCGIALGRKSYKYQGRSYCSKCFMQLKK